MAEDLQVVGGTREEKYRALLPHILALMDGEPDLIANLANICGALHEQFSWLWTGFYIVRSDELVLGPFQGPVACTRIGKGRGVCGTAWAESKTLIVPDVEKFPGHIACSSLSRSEIVVCVIRHGNVVAVLDADSEHASAFDSTDAFFLGAIADKIPWPA